MCRVELREELRQAAACMRSLRREEQPFPWLMGGLSVGDEVSKGCEQFSKVLALGIGGISNFSFKENPCHQGLGAFSG